MEIDAAVQPQIKVNSQGEVTSCGVRVVGIRSTGLTKADTKVDGFDMSINLFGDGQPIGASKVVYLEGKKGDSLASPRSPEAKPIESFWLRSSTMPLKDMGRFVPGETKHSLIAAHEFLTTFEFILQVMEEQTLKLGLNFSKSSQNMAYSAKIGINEQDRTELAQCFGGLRETLGARASSAEQTPD